MNILFGGDHIVVARVRGGGLEPIWRAWFTELDILRRFP